MWLVLHLDRMSVYSVPEPNQLTTNAKPPDFGMGHDGQTFGSKTDGSLRAPSATSSLGTALMDLALQGLLKGL